MSCAKAALRALTALWRAARSWRIDSTIPSLCLLKCVIDGPTYGRPWASDAARAQLRRVALKAGAAYHPRVVAENERIFQEAQPEGVPPLEMTGERTLPDLPAENYWYQRHVVVYDWVAQRVAGKRVIDMACGEGYGTEIFARTAAAVVGVDANPEAYEHAQLKYAASNLRFERQLIEEFSEPADVIVFLQTVEHVHDPTGLVRRFRQLVPPADGQVVISTPNVLTLAPPGAEKSDNPWHVKEYRPAEFNDLLQPLFRVVELFGLYHAGRLSEYTRISDGLLNNHELIPQITSSDFQLRPAGVAELEGALDLIAVAHP